MDHSNDSATAVAHAFDIGESGYLPDRPRQPAHLGLDHARLLIAYAGAGSIGTAAHFAILYTALSAVGTVAASTLGATVGCLVNFALSRRIVFHDRQPVRHALLRFMSVAASAVALNAVVLKALIATLPLFLSQALSTAAVFLFTFALNNGWTFGERQK